MRSSLLTPIVAALAVLSAASSLEAQGSWLPYGKVGASDIAVSTSGVVWLIAKEPRSIRSNLVLGETAFLTPSGWPAHVAADLNGFPWLVNSDGTVWHWVRNGTEKEHWVQSPLKAIDIAVGANGATWAIDTDQHVVQLRNDSWKSMGGSAVKISVDPSGNPWIVNAAGQVSHWTGRSWTPVPGNAIDISVAPDGNVFILGTTRVRGGFEILRLNGSTWDHIVGGGGVAISAGPKSVYVAQDTTTYLVLSSETSKLSTADTGPSTNATTAAASTGVVTRTPETRAEKGATNSLPARGTAEGALGALGGLLSTGATAAGGAATGAIGKAAGNVAGNAAGNVAGSAGNVAGGAAGAAGGAAGSVVAIGIPGSPGSSGTPSSQGKLNPDDELNFSAARPLARLPIPGSLRCPIIGSGAAMERACELLGRAALKLSQSPSTDCATYKAPPGYGTPYRDSTNGSDCWVCPLPLQRSLSAIKSLTTGNFSACFGKSKELFVWQLGQFPDAGSYNFMPGLLRIALADPKAVDAFLDKRANGDTARKRQLWAEMIADPSNSAELKALLFASLLSVAKEDSANPVAKNAVHEFESYVQRRRWYVASESLRMYKKAREVDTFFAQAKDSIRSEAVETAATDFKTYAWSSVLPDSSGTAFVVASAALSELGASGGAGSVANTAISSLKIRYLEPVTQALADELDMIQDKRADMMEKARTLSTIAKRARALKNADPAMIGTTLLGAAMKVSKGVMSLFGRDKIAAEYERYVEEMAVPVRVKDMLESTNAEDRQALLLYWALATSPHKASDKIGTGAMTGEELCNSDSWTAAECSSAKAMILAAAKTVGYSN